MTRGALLPWRLATAALIACALSGVRSMKPFWNLRENSRMK